MKKIFLMFSLVILFIVSSCSSTSTTTITTEDPEMVKFKEVIAYEKRGCFDFFWEEQASEEGLKNYGLIPDRYPNNGLSSIASVGFGLAGIAVGVDSGYITFEEGYNRVLKSLQSFQKNLTTKEGFYYRFYNYYTAQPSPGSEISVIDTGIFVCGAMTSAQYFGGEVAVEAKKIYDAINWPWYVDQSRHMFYMGYESNGDGTHTFKGHWDFYAEQLMLYFLGAGSSTHPTSKVEYDAFTKRKGKMGDYEFIYSWFGSIFTHQFSHAFIDFRNLRDADGINWYENSVQATYASRQFAINMSSFYPSLGELAWGFTACDGPNGYSGKYGFSPNGYNKLEEQVDGTVPPAGALGSLPFAPEIIIPTINNYATMLDGKLVDYYGFVDSFNLEVLDKNGDPWIANDVIGIDKGISLLMIANYESEFVWKYFMQNEFMNTAIERLGFTVVTEE